MCIRKSFFLDSAAEQLTLDTCGVSKTNHIISPVKKIHQCREATGVRNQPVIHLVHNECRELKPSQALGPFSRATANISF
jgi:hypothetical protein